MQTNTKPLLDLIETGLRHGNLTPCTKIDDGTLICFTEATPIGTIYHQYPYEQLPALFQAAFKDRIKGDRAGHFKIVAIFDNWV